jgi:hypothetical protein
MVDVGGLIRHQCGARWSGLHRREPVFLAAEVDMGSSDRLRNGLEFTGFKHWSFEVDPQVGAAMVQSSIQMLLCLWSKLKPLLQLLDRESSEPLILSPQQGSKHWWLRFTYVFSLRLFFKMFVFVWKCIKIILFFKIYIF